MLEKYESLNAEAKSYLLQELNKIFSQKNEDDALFSRCCKEIDLLYDRGLLFIIKILYMYKKENGTSYHFRGMVNNLVLLYVLEISNVDSIKYKLPYELFNDSSICVDLVNDHPFSLVWYIERELHDELKIIYGSHTEEDIKNINAFLDNHYLLLPFVYNGNDGVNITFRLNEYFLFETIADYRKYSDQFLTIRIDEKQPISEYKVKGLENVLTNDFEKEIADILQPKTIKDYVKVKSIGHGTDVWNYNQDVLVAEGKITLDNLIATREDILEYLLDHSIDKDVALEILNFIRKGRPKKDPEKWDEYVGIMKEHNCEDMFINIFSKILFIFGRGQAVSECLFALDEENYINERSDLK